MCWYFAYDILTGFFYYGRVFFLNLIEMFERICFLPIYKMKIV